MDQVDPAPVAVLCSATLYIDDQQPLPQIITNTARQVSGHRLNAEMQSHKTTSQHSMGFQRRLAAAGLLSNIQGRIDHSAAVAWMPSTNIPPGPCCLLSCALQGGGMYIAKLLDNMTHAAHVTVRNKAV